MIYVDCVIHVIDVDCVIFVDYVIFVKYVNFVIDVNFRGLRADEEYIRRQLREAQEESGDSMKSLRWDGATLRKVRESSQN